MIFDRALDLLLAKVEGRKDGAAARPRPARPGPDNITLHCRAHNAYEGRRLFGDHLPREIREARVEYDATLFAVPEREVRKGPLSRGAPGDVDV